MILFYGVECRLIRMNHIAVHIHPRTFCGESVLRSNAFRC